ncbi:2-octaprenyl-6-methoxyphenol hydroxylase [Limimaricola variabilis]|uniref:2-octaprenyl-6-methoxyphenol hydroxylase n=1 Tax=Limimaricola variabilis TaxID=1492771 RepID=A0ABR6HNT5_9RHOB|nr:FAD-dependent monooxygenase [Limimaricola variabilis]MBB3712217.1 2-octaprenyl-6-methoxyphenol hydroxylase [Limimaricola variabilis]
MTARVDILVSGGGIAGLSAAAAFGAAGFSVLCVDPAPPVREMADTGADLRSTAFLQPARDLLERAGLWAALTPHATPLQVMRIVEAGRGAPVIRDFDAADLGPLPFGWNLPNWLLRREMAARLDEMERVEFRAGCGFAGLSTCEDRALVRLSDGTSVAAKLVVAADGRASPVREACGIGLRTRRYGQKALAFAVTHERPHENVSTEIHRSGGPFTLVPLPDHEGQHSSAVIWMERGREVERLAALPVPDFDIEATARSERILGRLHLVTPRQSWPIVMQTARALTAQRVALVAEAAHVMPPIGAQGLNTSLADIACLVDLAAARPQGLGDAAMLDVYAKRRAGDIALREHGIDALNRLAMVGGPVAQGLRGLGLGVLHDVAPLRRRLMRLGLGAR